MNLNFLTIMLNDEAQFAFIFFLEKITKFSKNVIKNKFKTFNFINFYDFYL
jgi:hypothetical protein